MFVELLFLIGEVFGARPITYMYETYILIDKTWKNRWSDTAETYTETP